MRQRAFCEYCIKENEYKVNKANKICILKDEEINYYAKEAICNSCGNEIFVSDICDYNLNVLYEEYKKKYNIIKVIEIKQIIIKYSISEEALSSLLGWEKKIINRYLDGDMPAKVNSDTLRKIYEDTNHYLSVLKINKERIDAIDYNKSRQSVKSILSDVITEEKIDAVIKYMLIRCDDFTPLALQKLLYYVQAFYYMFTDDFIFMEDCEAYIDGPVYSSVYERYKKFGYEEINRNILGNDRVKLEDVERNVIESVITFYSCYSGKILKQMTNNETPWLLTRARIFKQNDDNKIIGKSLISDYFKGIKEKYNMINILDIQKYSIDLFNKISM